MMGGLDVVVEIIFMFFMVIYGFLCLIFFLQYFVVDLFYCFMFWFCWYIFLFGAIVCFGLMFFMNVGYVIMVLLFMVGIYLLVSCFNLDKKNIVIIFQGVIFQISWQLQVFLQKVDKEQIGSWCLFVVCIFEYFFDWFVAFDMFWWIVQCYGFGIYIYKINGYLFCSIYQEVSVLKACLIKMVEAIDSNIYIDILISLFYILVVVQVIQLFGIFGMDNNLLFVEFSKVKFDNLEDIVDNFKFIKLVDFDLVIFGSLEWGYGLK